MGFFKQLKDAIFGYAPDTSEKKSVDVMDLAKVIRTGLLLAASTGITFIINNIEPGMFGKYAGMATIAIAMLSELSMRFLKDNTPK